MKGLVKTGARTLTMQELETPKPDGHDVIVKVTHCGICGSDVHMWIPDDRIGLVFGHEFSGIVEDPGASGLKKGDRVSVMPSSVKGRGFALGVNGAQGAYAEYVRQDPKFIRKLPKDLDNETAAMIEPMAIGLHAVRRTNIDINDKVLITGTGIIGLACAEWVRVWGADTIVFTEVNPDKIAMVEKMGIADKILNAKDENIKEQILELTGGQGFDKTLECTGTQSGLQLCIDSTKYMGQITYVGIDYHPISLLTRPIVANQLSVIGSYGGMALHCDEIIHHMGKGRVNPSKFVTSRISLDQVQAKLEELSTGNTKEIKSMIVIE